ncbi:DNA-3-methyladenine glycosylase family protein [Klenkia brasiliensis]|uniref:3-methyladenine DNA glycosylase/8-oxoguanine DNA glycosylase n=1 Tax=Klenkia brasiliensis TaxID=333142 RepID=A0A1G7W8H6_9ACTN|nr:3-methyladenine DNA glycosylase [Klenkia brasiliensis]SDG68241.1 3-methyladenine DNA glycosylase/8-oxoguanine DNA glycosylase [Klenkia brasiliensis]
MTAATVLPRERTWQADWPLDVRRALSPHRHGHSDPTLQYAEDGAAWRTTTTPDGAATVRLTARGGLVRAQAWGPGAAWALEAVPRWLGAEDRPEDFPADRHPLVQRLHRASPWLRIGGTGRVWDALVPAVLEQKVTGIEAHRTFVQLLRLAGDPAPGPAPAGMRVVPSAQRVRAVTDWEWHRCGLDGARRRALLAVASVASRLECDDHTDCEGLRRRLRSVPGIGVWTAAEVAQRAIGCPDQVSVGDYHLKNLVGWSLAGRKTDDAGMLELLEPFRGHRQRVVRLLEVGGSRPPKRGPRMAPTDHRRL